MDPNDPETERTLGELERRMYDPTGGRTEVIRPPSPFWMHYVTNRGLNPGIAPDVIELADRFPDDPGRTRCRNRVCEDGW